MNLKKTYDLQSLATLLGCSAQQLGYYIYKRDIALQYKRFKILKKSGDIREISSPATNLKIIQKNLERELSTLLRFRGAVNGFVRGRNIKRNASMHVGQRHILNIDLQNFFQQSTTVVFSAFYQSLLTILRQGSRQRLLKHVRLTMSFLRAHLHHPFYPIWFAPEWTLN